MNDSEFHQAVDKQLMMIEEMIDNSGADIDYETTGNVMTLEFENRSQVIINRQEPLHEIWLASKEGGYHFQISDGKWLCTRSGLEFVTAVKKACDVHSDEIIEWEA